MKNLKNIHLSKKITQDRLENISKTRFEEKLKNINLSLKNSRFDTDREQKNSAHILLLIISEAVYSLEAVKRFGLYQIKEKICVVNMSNWRQLQYWFIQNN